MPGWTTWWATITWLASGKKTLDCINLLLAFFLVSFCFSYLYIKRCITESLARLLWKNEISVVTRPHKILQQEFPFTKFWPPFELQTNVVYKISCTDYPWSYIGETGRCFPTRKIQLFRNVKKRKTGSNIAAHSCGNNHSIDFNNARVTDKGIFRIRNALESWHTANTNKADNNSKSLPKQ